MRGFLLLLGLLAMTVGASRAESPPAATSNVYADDASWLCRPGRQDACAADMTSTVVAADGTMTREDFHADPNPAIDCFYVYPTVSMDPGLNSDMTPGVEEAAIAAVQAARFAAHCRVFAPLYRQVTLTALLNAMTGKGAALLDFETPYRDVRDAWRDYLARDNDGRGVVLIGHSQGAGMLTRLMAEEIDGKPAQGQLVSALLIGGPVSVPRGADVGGTFKAIPACRAAGQIGCVISYAAFRDTLPPPADTLFGKPGPWEGPPDPNKTVLCTNPADLAGGKGEPHSYFTASGSILGARLTPVAWVAPPAPVTTNFVSTPGLLTTECVSNEYATYLSVRVNADPGDPRTDTIGGDVVLHGQALAQWGLHLIDMPIAMGDLVRIVGEQAKAYTAGR